MGGVGWKNEWALSQEAGNPPCRTLDASEQFLLSLSLGLGSPGAGGSWIELASLVGEELLPGNLEDIRE